MPHVLPILLLSAQLAAATPVPVYSSPAVGAIVAAAAASNRAPPAGFAGYRASVESELALILRDSIGRERAGQVEQVASTVEWRPGRSYRMDILGYRQQSRGTPLSALTFVRGWTIPSLYGERLVLGASFGNDTTRPRARDSTTGRAPIVAVHPLAADRERFYRYSGGDTVAVLHTGRRTIHIVRLRVTPHLSDSTRLAAMDGEIYVDAERAQVVRMRGRFVVLGRDTGIPLAARLLGAIGVAYMEFVNTEVNGEVWLPETQRTEMQAANALLGATHAVLRVQSRFSGYETMQPLAAESLALRTPSARVTRWAPSDSISRFTDWHSTIGEMTSSVSANDFDDLAPDHWRSTGRPVLDLMPKAIENLVRYDRVEGLFAGLEANLRLRSAAPGAVIGARAGWAFTERTVRGDVHASLARGQAMYGARVARTLANTNDFAMPGEPQSSGLEAVLGIDDYDYIDRRLAVASVARSIGLPRGRLLTLQVGAGKDVAEHTRLDRGLAGGDDFLPNRGIREGSYALGVLEAELHPDATGGSVTPGVAARARVEMGRGQLAWTRAELAIWARRYSGPITLDFDASAGALLGRSLVPQALFELGGRNALPGYAFKQFAGDRAALFRGYAGYALPLWRAPLRFSRFTIPGVSPGFAVSMQGGWTDITSEASRAAVSELGSLNGMPVSVASGRVRASAGAGVTLFSGFVHLGIARPIDVAAPWKFVAGLGHQF